MINTPNNQQLRTIKFLLFLICLWPFGRLLWLGWTNDFGPEPAEFTQRWTGLCALSMLLLTLSISPLRGMTQMHWLLRLRRMLGLFVIFYATLHFFSFIGFNHDFLLDEIVKDVTKRPFIIVGFAAFLLLIPLACTSNQWAIRKLGGRKWQNLHRNIYLISILVAVHFFWQAKGIALIGPVVYSGLLAILLGWRVQERRRKAIYVPKTQTAKPLKFFKQKPD